jgi:hypothetical protein
MIAFCWVLRYGAPSIPINALASARRAVLFIGCGLQILCHGERMKSKLFGQKPAQSNYL